MTMPNSMSTNTANPTPVGSLPSPRMDVLDTLAEVQEAIDSENWNRGQVLGTMGLLQVMALLTGDYFSEKEEAKKSGREGEWVRYYYIEAPPRPPIEFKSEEDAKEGYRHAREALGDKAEINVTCREVKIYSPEVIDPEVEGWEKPDEPEAPPF